MSIIQTIASLFSSPQKKRAKQLYDSLYWPILQKIVPAPSASNWGFRFPDAKACMAEAMACAEFHAGMEFKILSIVHSNEVDPWTRSAGQQIDIVAMRRAAGTFVVYTETGLVYDHRVRYCMPEPWAYKLGFINPVFLWKRLGAPQVNPYPASYKEAASYYRANNTLKSRAGYVE